MTKQSPQSDIPQQLSLFLHEMGIVEIKEEVTEPEKYVAWLPSYEGENHHFKEIVMGNEQLSKWQAKTLECS